MIQSVNTFVQRWGLEFRSPAPMSMSAWPGRLLMIPVLRIQRQEITGASWQRTSWTSGLWTQVRGNTSICTGERHLTSRPMHTCGHAPTHTHTWTCIYTHQTYIQKITITFPELWHISHIYTLVNSSPFKESAFYFPQIYEFTKVALCLIFVSWGK